MLRIYYGFIFMSMGIYLTKCQLDFCFGYAGLGRIKMLTFSLGGCISVFRQIVFPMFSTITIFIRIITHH